MDATANFYSRPSYSGGSFPVFSGSRRQRGGSIFGALKRIALPMVKRIGSSLLNTVKTEGVKLGKDVLSDIAEGRNIKETLVNRGKAAAINVGKRSLRNAVKTVTGAGRKRRRRRRSTFKQIRKRSASKQKRKRRRRLSKKPSKRLRRNF